MKQVTQQDVEAVPHVEHPDLRGTIIDFWSRKLYAKTGLDFLKAEQVYRELGNTSGMYPDTLLAFANIIQYYDIKKILELGSGFSTLFLACMAKKQGAEFRSFEEAEYYHQLTRTFLEAYGYSPDLVQPWPKIEPALFEGVEFLFLDNMNRGDLLVHGHELFSKVPIIVVDDCDGYGNRQALQFMQQAGRSHMFPFQGGGRMDRTQFFIHLPETCLPTFLYQTMGYL